MATQRVEQARDGAHCMHGMSSPVFPCMCVDGAFDVASSGDVYFGMTEAKEAPEGKGTMVDL